MNYKVIKIVNEYLLVINYGTESHAEVGDILEIFQVGEKVYDPDNNDLLGTLDISKGKIQVKNIYEKMSLCESHEFTKKFPEATKSFNATVLALSNNFAARLEQKALAVNTQQITGGYNEGDKGVINISDPVRIIKSKYLDEIVEEDFPDQD
ncbi:MAG: hypothetical protein K6T88_19855 [Bacillus sp. (in: Bacteria)]|nr:hypothetical protein [Bacillus sp. (in: firmicutes)]